jgi:hypothetical protein
MLRGIVHLQTRQHFESVDSRLWEIGGIVEVIEEWGEANVAA